MPRAGTMPFEWTLYFFGGLAAICMGFAKTGMPGTSVLAVALMAQAFRHNAELSVGAMLPILLVGDIVAVACYRRHTSWSRLWRLFPAVSVGLVIGFSILHIVEGNELRPVLGLLVALMFVAELVRRRVQADQVPHGWAFTSGVGVLAGFGTMVGNAAGPVMTLYLLSQELPKDRFMGTCAVFFFTVNLTKVVPYTLEGMINGETLAFALFGIPMTVVGVILGRWAFHRFSQRTFDALILCLAGLAAVWLFLG